MQAEPSNIENDSNSDEDKQELHVIFIEVVEEED